MSTKEQERPRFTEQDALRIAEDLFGITGQVQELPSERDRNFRLRTDTGEEYVLKIAAASETKENLEFQNEVMQHLQEKGVNCPKVLQTKTEEQISVVEDTEGISHFVRMLTYLPGKVLAKVNPHSPELFHEFGCFLGSLSTALEEFSHPAAHRDFYWDLKNASTVISLYKEHIGDPKKAAIVDHFLREYETRVLPVLPDLRTSVVHNDGNDYNIIVNKACYPEERSFGIIDFGDMVATHTVFELAVATAYAILGKDDPIAAASGIVGGYHSIFPLTELELKVLFPLICTRLALSVAISAYQQKLEPDNEYLKISEKSAWKLLSRLRTIHPRFATYAFRHACQMTPCPQSSKVVNWLRQNKERVGPLLEIDLQTAPVTIIDFSISSPELTRFTNVTSINAMTDQIFSKIAAARAKVGIGRYNEARMIYIGVQYLATRERRTIHTGIDLFLKPGTPVLAPLDGKVHSFLNNTTPFDYGPTIILEHKIQDSDLKFFTLYGHLSLDSLEGLTHGKPIKRGEKIAEVGAFPVNGGWPPHLHFQLITDLLDKEGDFPGVALPSQRDIWLSISPDPNLMLKIPKDCFPEARLSRDEILTLREKYIGGVLSLHYRNPLTIVRGYMQYLFDDTGQAYLDAVNNVPHVGHSHPRVVRALSEQAALLYTNSRYLHENMVLFAQRLCATLPEPLSVCFFVNSGSEANELALRLAHTHTAQQDLIVIDGAYHGNTGTLTGISPYKFDGLGGKGAPPHVHKVTMPDVFRGEYKRDDPNAGPKYASEVRETIKQLKGENRG
ncbi:MAG: aminotransferase class III-fold pyridoxal phosphate-dependent enzyme, partial [Promethearchaeota archaeon]